MYIGGTMSVYKLAKTTSGFVEMVWHIYAQTREVPKIYITVAHLQPPLCPLGITMTTPKAGPNANDVPHAARQRHIA